MRLTCLSRLLSASSHWRSFMLTGLVLVLVPAWCGATVPEDDSSVAEKAPSAAAKPLQISEATTAISPYVAATQQDVVARKASQVIGYIQQHNKKLPSSESMTIAQAIVQYSERYGVDYRLLTSVIAIESSFRRDAVSSSGAIGMGQLKPSTAKWLGVLNPYDPVDNIAGTARFLSWLVKKYNGNLEYALSAYYQGPGHVDRNGITPVCMPYLEKVNRALGPLL